MQLLLRSLLWTVIVLAPGGFLLLPLALKRPAAAPPAAPLGLGLPPAQLPAGRTFWFTWKKLSGS